MKKPKWKDGDTLVLSTGKEILINTGVIGIDQPDKDGNSRMYWGFNEIYEGLGNAESKGINITNQEQIEIAGYMVDLWTRFKESVGRDKK